MSGTDRPGYGSSGHDGPDVPPELSRAWRDARGDLEPPPELDAAVRDFAHAAIQPRPRRWAPILAVAATLALAVGLALRLPPIPESAPPPPPPAPSEATAAKPLSEQKRERLARIAADGQRELLADAMVAEESAVVSVDIVDGGVGAAPKIAVAPPTEAEGGAVIASAPIVIAEIPAIDSDDAATLGSVVIGSAVPAPRPTAPSATEPEAEMAVDSQERMKAQRQTTADKARSASQSLYDAAPEVKQPPAANQLPAAPAAASGSAPAAAPPRMTESKPPADRKLGEPAEEAEADLRAEAADEAQHETAERSEVSDLSEVIVTAYRRNAALQDVPVSIEALDTDGDGGLPLIGWTLRKALRDEVRGEIGEPSSREIVADTRGERDWQVDVYERVAGYEGEFRFYYSRTDAQLQAIRYDPWGDDDVEALTEAFDWPSQAVAAKRLGCSANLPFDFSTNGPEWMRLPQLPVWLDVSNDGIVASVVIQRDCGFRVPD